MFRLRESGALRPFCAATQRAAATFPSSTLRRVSSWYRCTPPRASKEEACCTRLGTLRLPCRWLASTSTARPLAHVANRSDQTDLGGPATATEDGLPVHTFVRRRFRDAGVSCSFAAVKMLIRKGLVRYDHGARARDSSVVRRGDVVVAPLPRQEPKPRSVQLSTQQVAAHRAWFQQRTLYEDDHYLAINKPSGLAVQGGSSLGLDHVDAMLPALAGLHHMRQTPRLVHRLDKDVSGVLLLAKHAEAARRIGEVFKRKSLRGIDKTYVAVVHGAPPQARGRIKAPLMAHSGKVSVGNNEDADKRWSVSETEFAVADRFGEVAALMVLHPRTGRKHQIRVHCASVLGTPIVGDKRYGASISENNPLLQALRAGGAPLDREERGALHLHAHRLDFFHPFRERPVSVSAPLPSRMRETLRALALNEDLIAKTLETKRT